MARLIPNIEVDDIGLKPERDVARAIVEALPNDCLVYHSYPWLKTDRNDRDGSTRLREGETDFVILLPSHGLLILEVKGGDIEFDPVDHGWYRKLGRERRKPIRDPFEQARRNTYYLIDQCVEKHYRATGRVPFVFGYAVVFPDCDYTGPAPPGAEPVIVLSARDLSFMKRRLMDVLQKWNPSGKHRPVEIEDQAIIKSIISPPFKLLPVLFRQIEEEAEKLFQLTEDQIQLLDFLSSHNQASIEGVAGSGKTMLARAQAQRFADEGKQTLFLCYNKALAQWLRESIPEQYNEKIVVLNFHTLCREFCNQAKIPFRPPRGSQDEFWKTDAPNLLLEASGIVNDRYDAIVIDEAQDFHPNWWFPIQMLNIDDEEGPMYIFYDPAQNLFVDVEKNIPDLGQPFILPTNCRNTKKIASTCGDILGVNIQTRPMAPEGAEVEFILALDQSTQQEHIGRLLHEWINRGNISKAQVAILSPVRWENSSLPKKAHIRNVPLTLDIDEWRENKGVLFSTIRAFKGLEADIVIISDVPAPENNSKFTKNDLYVACSRAKHRLVVIAKNDFF